MHEKRVTVRLPPYLVEEIDKLVEGEEYFTRSEFVRHAVHDYLINNLDKLEKAVEKLKEEYYV